MLHGVQAGTAFDQMRGKAVPQRVRRGIGQVEFLAREHEQALQRVVRHRARRGVHAFGQSLRRVVATACIGEEQQWMAMKLPVVTQVFEHRRRQWDGAVLVAFAGTDAQLVLAADDIMDGQVQTLRKAQPAAVDELQRRAVAPQADVLQERLHLLAREHRRQRVVILRLDLIKEPPTRQTQLLAEEHLRRRQRLTHRLRLPPTHRLHMQQVIAQLLLGDEHGITCEVLAEQPQVPVVTVPRAHRIIAQREHTSELRHRRPRMRVMQRVRIQLATAQRSRRRSAGGSLPRRWSRCRIRGKRSGRGSGGLGRMLGCTQPTTSEMRIEHRPSSC